MDCTDETGQAIARNIAQTIARRIAMGIAFFLAFLVFVFLGGFVVQWLWNWLMTDIFGLRPINWWEAFGLLALSRILFGGFGRGGGGSRERARHRDWWKKHGDAHSAPEPAGGQPQ